MCIIEELIPSFSCCLFIYVDRLLIQDIPDESLITFLWSRMGPIWISDTQIFSYIKVNFFETD